MSLVPGKLPSFFHCKFQLPSKHLKSQSQTQEENKSKLTLNQRFSVAAFSATQTLGSGDAHRMS